MKALLLLVLAPLWAAAAETAQPGPAAWAQAVPGGFWMKRYPERRYGALWHLELTTRDFQKAKARVEKVLAKRGGVSTVPADSQVGSDKVRYLQWSYVFSRRDAEKAAADLKEAGTPRREGRQENLRGEADAEIASKHERLKAERAAAGTLFERLPATAAAVEEIRAHLEAVLRASEDSEDRVLFNLSLEQEAP
ncbi:MAG: hypothetical protein HY928_05895 [Elusimicrobia bacterium]|nr:hypothetical protein [Elusimicrobiota bacterium]